MQSGEEEKCADPVAARAEELTAMLSGEAANEVRANEAMEVDEVPAKPKPEAFVYLVVPDGDTTARLKISRKAAKLSSLLCTMIGEDDDDKKDKEADEPHEDEEIPLKGHSIAAFKRIVEFLEHHADDPMKPIEWPIQTNVIEHIVGPWDVAYVSALSWDELMELSGVALYFMLTDLVRLCITMWATMLKDKTPEEVRVIMKMEEDINQEQERVVRDANQWVFEVTPEGQAAAKAAAEKAAAAAAAAPGTVVVG